MGIGSKLVREGLSLAKEMGFDLVLVLGHEGYYPRFGFEPGYKYDFRPNFEAPKEAFMLLNLGNRELEKKPTLVIYPREFFS